MKLNWPPSVLGRIVGWLREGYPKGMPEHNYVPLLALLCRRLTTEEVDAVARLLRSEGRVPATDADIGTLIMKITDELPRGEDVTRVRRRLALGGWPITDPPGEN
jgi:hypothetical protein